MASSEHDKTTLDDFSHLQDVLGNMPMHKRYTPLCLFFRLQDVDITQVEDTLKTGLSKLSSVVPFPKGQLIFEGMSPEDPGTARIIPFEDTIKLVTKDLTQDESIPSLADLENRKFPINSLPDSNFLPLSILPDHYNSSQPYVATQSRPARIFLVQATFIRGGLVLAFVSNHATMDMNGMGQIITLVAKACRGEPLTPSEIAHANQDRRHVLPLYDSSFQPGPESARFMYPAPAPTPAQSDIPPAPQPKVSTAIIYLSPQATAALKTLASQQSITPYISTNDAITAFLWHRITVARLARLPKDSDATTSIVRQMSARAMFNLKGYAGLMTASAHTKIPLHPLPSISEISGALRASLLDTASIAHEFQSMATVLSRARGQEKVRVGYGASLNWDCDLVFSSYAEIGASQEDFGNVLGKPLAVRRPLGQAEGPGGVNALPRDADGGFAVVVGLLTEDMEQLRNDEVFREYAEYVG